MSACQIFKSEVSCKMESKFAHLLQPIRDLAGNWDVNVAEELEEYLVSPWFVAQNTTTGVSKYKWSLSATWTND